MFFVDNSMRGKNSIPKGVTLSIKLKSTFNIYYMIQKFGNFITEASSSKEDLNKAYVYDSFLMYYVFKDESIDFMGGFFEIPSHLNRGVSGVEYGCVSVLSDDFNYVKLDGYGYNSQVIYDEMKAGKPYYRFFIYLILVDEDDKKNLNRYQSFFKSNIQRLIGNNFSVYATLSLSGIKQCFLDIKIIDNKFNYSLVDDDYSEGDPFTTNNLIKIIKNDPRQINKVARFFKKETLFELLDKNPEYLNWLETQLSLEYQKQNKLKVDPKRSQMEEDNQMYVFAMRDKFKEDENGLFRKDIEIERMVPIDPYDENHAYIIKMLKLRANSQGDLKTYCIWLPKDAYTEDELDDINSDEYEYLRNAINSKKERI
jgi:hypothetical protein